MKKRHITIPAAIFAVTFLVGWLAAPTAQAHDGVASGTCQGGVQWSYTQYDKTVVNSITVTIDGTVRYHDGDFKASDTGAIATDKTTPHTWSVVVNAPGTQFDRTVTGSYPACVVAPTTTTVAQTTTTVAVTTTVPVTTVATTVPATTPPTTTVVAQCCPPVPCQSNPTIPAGSPLCVAPTTTVAATDVVVVEPVLPRTGGGSSVLPVAAIICIGVGTAGLFATRRKA